MGFHLISEEGHSDAGVIMARLQEVAQVKSNCRKKKRVHLLDPKILWHSFSNSEQQVLVPRLPHLDVRVTCPHGP